MKHTAVIIDDEPLARAIIREYLERYPYISIVAECGDGKEAVQTINRLQPDLAFLDIQMPEATGFEALREFDPMPVIVFSTAYDQFALQAFDVNAVDYLLKPYTQERFDAALAKALDRCGSGASELDKLSALIRDTAPKQFPETLFVRVGQKILSLNAKAIIMIEAAGDYSTIYTQAESHLCGIGIGELEKRLDPARFIRVHRSNIVATDALVSFVSDGDGGYVATLANGAKIRISRSYAGKLRHLII